uniref:Ig-like domain-containing protein n=1 Tax=Hucho hucho TaxID=62062 RepID=A0A4W5KC17_9TELE
MSLFPLLNTSYQSTMITMFHVLQQRRLLRGGRLIIIAGTQRIRAKSCGALQLKMMPQIKRHPTNMTLLIESKAVLPCVMLGNPKPDISWIKDNAFIQVPIYFESSV